jgi:phytoene synthase
MTLFHATPRHLPNSHLVDAGRALDTDFQDSGHDPVATAAATHAAADPGQAPDFDRLRVLMRGGSKSFFAASLMLPARVRGPATALYAFCRLADDAIDLGTDPHAAMRDLQQRLDAIYARQPRAIDADIALAAVVHQHGIPRELPDALLEGFLWDTQQRRHETLADVEAYSARVAATVGAMMALVMGTRDAAALARACDLGVAMQLTNIARDVGEDARAGRLYLPRQWLTEAGIDADAWLRAPVFNPAIASVIERLLQAADALYRRAEHGIAALPRDCRPAIRAARLVYAEIGEQLRRDGLDSISHRVVVSKQRKLALMARAAGAAVSRQRRPAAPMDVLPAVQFLVDAAAAPVHALGAAASTTSPVAATPHAPAAAKRRPLGERMGWVIALHEREAIARQDARGALG